MANEKLGQLVEELVKLQEVADNFTNQLALTVATAQEAYAESEQEESYAESEKEEAKEEVKEEAKEETLEDILGGFFGGKFEQPKQTQTQEQYQTPFGGIFDTLLQGLGGAMEQEQPKHQEPKAQNNGQEENPSGCNFDKLNKGNKEGLDELQTLLNNPQLSELLKSNPQLKVMVEGFLKNNNGKELNLVELLNNPLIQMFLNKKF